MPIVQQIVIALSLVVLLAGCGQQEMMDKLAPKQEVAQAKLLVSQLAAKDFAAVESQLDSSIRSTSVRSALEKMAAAFPAEKAKSIATVGSRTVKANGVTSYDLTFEHEYASSWLITNVGLQERDGKVTVVGIHVNPMKQSLAQTSAFTFEGKSPLHYVVLALAIAVPSFIVYSLVLCLRTPVVKRKWLWLLFVAIGFVQLSFNWTSGAYGVQLISFALLGGGFSRAGPFAPLILHVAVPVGAIVFLARRRSLTESKAG